MQRRKGFTTVELVIVIAVIAILATALIPTFGGLIDSANHNADVQNARNLTTQLMMYAMDHEINDEADLREALNTTMGEDFYETLAPKSAKKGYCYWYDYNNCQIVLGTIEEIIEESKKQAAVPSEWGYTMANGLTGSTNFAPGNLRGQIIPGYFLMGRDTNSPLIKLIIDLETADEVTYKAALANINTLPTADAYKDNAKAVEVLTKFVAAVNSTPILNSYGLLIPQSAIDAATAENNPTKIQNVYIPLGVDTLKGTIVCSENGAVNIAPSALLTSNFKLYIPTGTKVATDLLGLHRNNNQEMHISIKQEELADYFYSNATQAIIVLPNGSKFVQEADGTFTNLATGQPAQDAEGNDIQTGDYGTLESYAVSFEAANGESTVVLLGDTLYISYDHTGKIVLTANTFIGTLDGAANSTIPVISISSSIGEVKGTTSTFDKPADGSTFTVKVRGIEKTFTVKYVNVDPDSFFINSVGSETVIDKTVDVTYNSSDSTTFSWAVDFVKALNETIPGLSLNTDLNVVDNVNFRIENGKLVAGEYANTLKTGGEFSAKVEFKCANATTIITINFYDTKLTAFTYADGVVNMKNKGNATFDNKPYDFVIGDMSAVKLNQLFKAVDSTKFNKYTLNVSVAGASTSVDNWEDLDLINYIKTGMGDEYFETANVVEVSLSSYKGVAQSLKVLIVPGAYNITSAEDWKNAPNGKNLVILNGFTIDAALSEQTTPSLVPYSVELGAATLYGNLNEIDIPNFKVKNGGHNWFLSVKGGTLTHVIIDGPKNYGSKPVLIASLQGESFCTDVSAVHANPTSSGKSVIIKDSYLAGFRTPLTLQGGGEAHVTNTTFYGGNLANINIIDKSPTVYLTDVKTIQPLPNTADWTGIGIFVKNNVGDDTKIIAKNLQQYNFSTAQNLVDFAVGSISNIKGMQFTVSLGVSDVEPYLKPLKHGTYYHVGIMDMDILNLKFSRLASLALGALDLDSLQTLIDSACGSAHFDLSGSKSADEGSDLDYVMSNEAKKTGVKVKMGIEVMSGDFTIRAYGLQGIDESTNEAICDGNDCHIHQLSHPTGDVDEFLRGR